MQSLLMTPPPGARLVRHVGDRLRVTLSLPGGAALPDGWHACLRTNLGRAELVNTEILKSYFQKVPLSGASWHDIPMQADGREWVAEFWLTQTGYFRAKPYAVDPVFKQHWPPGPDLGVAVHPDAYRTANTLYCAFVRMFGASRTAATTIDEEREEKLRELDRQGYTVIPASGRLRDLKQQLPHIIDDLGCRILHLLPVNPVPTTAARFGRFGSPYAVQDLTAIDPALVDFDRRTTGVEQFRELAFEVHLRGGRLFLDLVINHTGWNATLLENHPEWYVRGPDGAFVSPGAWGVTWEDLVELAHKHPQLWDHLADVFLTWCRRGVDGFRCDAGYKVPVPAWQYITAKVREEFPNVIFLLEGLGGAWEATESLLTEGGLQWAYSELFQNHTPQQVASYLDHALRHSQGTGLLVNYSETHDNDRLAAKGREWSLLRNRLCALTSVSGAFGFTCGVEWLASEKINVHSSRGLSWDSRDNIVPELAQLNRLLADHPCFHDGATLTRLTNEHAQVYALHRRSAESTDQVLVLVNADVQLPRSVILDETVFQECGGGTIDLLDQPPLVVQPSGPGKVAVTVPAGGCYCLAPAARPRGRAGEEYRRARAQAAWALTAVKHVLPMEEIGPSSWTVLAKAVGFDPADFLGAVANLDRDAARANLVSALMFASRKQTFTPVVTWTTGDRRRVLPVPPGHWLLLRDAVPFRASLDLGAGKRPQHAQSIPVREGHVACFAPGQPVGDAKLTVERYAAENPTVQAGIRFLAPKADLEIRRPDGGLVLLTNGIGGMVRMAVDLGHVRSKYDCVLGANLHPDLPVDRHIFVKRLRVWVNAGGFVTPLDAQNLVSFDPGPPAQWRFIANAGDGRSVEIQLAVDMLGQINSTVLRFSRPQHPPYLGRDLPEEYNVSLTIRFDLEDRNFHTETRRTGGAEYHFTANTRPLPDRPGFSFAPAMDRQLRVYASAGTYHPGGEWSENIPHPVEQSRGQVAAGDAYSPGWFHLPLDKGDRVTLVLCADVHDPPPEATAEFVKRRRLINDLAIERAKFRDDDTFGRTLAHAARAFVVRRGEGKTIIAGYPWFLDWGRDSLICARGLVAAGLGDDVRALLTTFARFEENGTLPNTIHGEDATNRDTSDAPLWFGLACEETATATGEDLYAITVDHRGRTIRDVLREIAVGYLRGTPNGIRMDAASGLVWSPRHFTWMDTNHPAGTPREGYPVEIQVLWIRLLHLLTRLGAPPDVEPWALIARRAEGSLAKYYWLEEGGYLADLLIADLGTAASRAVVDHALRSNCLLAVSLGVVQGEHAQRCVKAALRHLVVPGALRSLAPLPVSPPLPILGSGGRLLNNPNEPYWGTYEGDEDTRRKPAYHNGTAWTWTFPVFCEALARAWEFDPGAVAAAKAYLGSMDRLLKEGCIGHLPEIVDGDAPHLQRGCDAQAWGVTEALRVWKLLNPAPKSDLPALG